MQCAMSSSMFVPMIMTRKFELPLEVVLPYSTEDTMNFWLTYLHQGIVGFGVTSVHTAVDNLFGGLLMLIKCQQDVLKYRLEHLTILCNFNVESIEQKITIEHQYIKRCIKFHNRIYQ